MNFDPSKFFIGLLDFFSILLPGALLTYLFMGEVGPVVFGDRYAKLAGEQSWAAFLFASYLFGHLIFLLGSWLDEFHDWARRYTMNMQIAFLAKRGRLLPWLARAPIWLVFKRERNLAVDRAGKIKQQALVAKQAKDAINTFQWSKAWLNAQSPTSLAVVQSFEADSKFFRCLTVVLLILLVAWPLQDQWPPAGIPIVLALVLLLLALWRYMEQRYKATNQAYWSVIALAAKDGKLAPDKSATEASSSSRAGGVVFPVHGRAAEYLLVEATNDPVEWVLPKGHVEEGEQPRETAMRKVHANRAADTVGAEERQPMSISASSSLTARLRWGRQPASDRQSVEKVDASVDNDWQPSRSSQPGRSRRSPSDRNHPAPSHRDTAQRALQGR